MTKLGILIVFVLSMLSSEVLPQQLPQSLKSYFDRNYPGWKLAGQCYEKESENKRILAGDFDGNGRRDYAVKFVRRGKGFFMAFLANDRHWKPFYLHIWNNADEAKFSALILFKKGESYEPASVPKLRFDAPADFLCESDVGGLHSYRNGKFITY